MNIEKTISEHAVSDILTPMLESQDRIVTEDVAPLFDQATGLDTPPASGTVTTTIEESRSVITAIIRKAWTATLTMLGGASVLSSIAAAYTYLRNRLQGNETYGIPDRRSEIPASSPLAANLALLNDRKISGVPEAADGMSMVQMLCSSVRNGILELTDSTTDWTLNKTLDVSLFPNISKVTLGMGKSTTQVISNCSQFTEIKTTNYKEAAVYSFVAFPNVSIEEFVIDVEYINIINSSGSFSSGTYRKIRLPKTKKYKSWNSGTFTGANLEEIDMSAVDEHIGEGLAKLTWDSPLKCVRWGTMKRFDTPYFGDNSSNLILMVFGQGTGVSLNLRYWNPTNALSSSASDLVADPTAHPTWKNLDQFLQNFREHIALRLTSNGSGKTLTLSQAVRDAIHAAEATYGIEAIIVTQKGWTLSPAPTA